MSAVRIIKLKNGGFTGAAVVEILAIPSKDNCHDSDGQSYCSDILNDVAHRSMNQDCSLELLLTSFSKSFDRDNNDVRIFIVFRKYSSDRTLLERELCDLAESVMSILSSNSYKCAYIRDEDYSFLISCYANSTENWFSKMPETEPVSERLGTGWYFNDYEKKNLMQFFSLFEALHGNRDTIVSFSFIPTRLNEQEIHIINNTYSLLMCNSKGDFMYPGANRVRKYFENFRENHTGSFFLTSVSVIGELHRSDEIAKNVMQMIRHGCPSVRLLTGRKTIKSSSFSDFVFFPWNHIAAEMSDYRQMMSLDSAYCRFPFLLAEKEAIALFSLPYDDGQIRGIEINHDAQVREKVGTKYFDEGNIHIGNLSVRGQTKKIGVPPVEFSRHALIVGMPGTGKTTFSVNVLLQMYRKNIPFLAIEPTKTEYRAMIDAIPDLQIFTPGKSDIVPYILNPFIPPEGITLEVFKPSLFSAFRVAFSMPSPLDILFSRAIDECYMKYGWRNYSRQGDPEAKPFGLHEFVIVFRKIIDNSSYSNESKNNMRSAGVFRLMNLIVQGGSVYDNINTVPVSDILSRPTVIELNAIESYEQKSLFMALLLIQIVLYTKHMHKGDGILKNVILIDEAHVLLGGGSSPVQEGSPDAGRSAVHTLQNMIAEIRSYGTGIIISDQSPQKVTKEIVGNTDIKVVFQLVQSEDREMMAKAMNMDGSDAMISRLRTGEAIVFFRGLSEPLKLITEDIRKAERIRLSVSDEEILERSHYWNKHAGMLIPYSECCMYPLCGTCNRRIREEAKYYANFYINESKPKVQNRKDLFMALCSLGNWISEHEEQIHMPEEAKFYNCTRIHVIRSILINSDIEVDAEFLRNTLRTCHDEVDIRLGYYEE